MERICEMGQVMRRAVQVDDQHYCSVRERLAQLEVSKESLKFVSPVFENKSNMTRYSLKIYMGPS